MTNNNVCSIVVTYNRKELLLKNIEALINQTYKHDIYIIDNNSTDGTRDFINNHYSFDENRIYYVNTGKNIGGAGGFAYGLEYAFQKHKYGYFWLMDDDGRPIDNDALSKIMNIVDDFDRMTVINSVVVNEDHHTLSFGLGDKKDLKEICEPIVYGLNNPFNGTLISDSCIEKVGFPRREYILGCDEVEYMSRIVKNGGNIITVKDSLYFHPSPHFNMFNWHGRLIVNPEGNWRYYYRIRNTTDYYKNYKSGFKAIMYGLKKIISCFIFAKPNKLKKTHIALRAFVDGYKGDFSVNDFHITGNYKQSILR